MLTVDNGIIERAIDAKNEITIAKEKDIISQAYMPLYIRNKTYNQEISSNDFETEIHKYENNVTVTSNGDNEFEVNFTETRHKYTIDNNMNIVMIHVHDWVEVGHVDANCGHEGYTDYACSICGETKRDSFPVTGSHNYVNYVCTVCGDEQGWVVPVGGSYYSIKDKKFLNCPFNNEKYNNIISNIMFNKYFMIMKVKSLIQTDYFVKIIYYER